MSDDGSDTDNAHSPRSKMSKKGDPRDPRTVLREDFQLAFNMDGVLKQVDREGHVTDTGFQFDVHGGNRDKNQKRYEDIGTLLDHVVFQLLEDEGGLKRIHFPENKEAKPSFFFASPDYQERDNLLVLIHGSGVVKAGQWARRLIINNSLKEGTQLPYIKKAKELDMGVVVLNTNWNKDPSTHQRLPESSSPEEHACFVWRNYISKANAQFIGIIPHSYGGVVTTKLVQSFPEEFKERVGAVLMTDSVHYLRRNMTMEPKAKEAFKHWANIGINFVASQAPLNHVLAEGGEFEVEERSAGHDTHEWTSFSAFKPLFEVLEQKMKEWTARGATRLQQERAEEK